MSHLMVRKRSKNIAGANYLVLRDIEMLEMNGYELTREISRLEAEAAHLTRIVAPTGSHFDLSANIST